jgi:hypothetical protein
MSDCPSAALADTPMRIVTTAARVLGSPDSCRVSFLVIADSRSPGLWGEGGRKK